VNDITLSSGAQGAPIALDNGAGIASLAITPDGTKVLCAGWNSPKLFIVNTSTRAVTTITLPANISGGVIAMSNALAYCICSGGIIAPVNLSTNTVNATATDAAYANAQTPGIAGFPDGFGFMSLQSAGTSKIKQRYLPYNNNWYQWGFTGDPVPSGIAINDRGSIFVGAANTLGCWFGGQFFIAASRTAFWGERATVSATPAH
jgi:hypothetical protein